MSDVPLELTAIVIRAKQLLELDRNGQPKNVEHVVIRLQGELAASRMDAQAAVELAVPLAQAKWAATGSEPLETNPSISMLVTLPTSVIQHLIAIGGGNLNAGILIVVHRTKQLPPPAAGE
jgi:hypothetical protein